MQYCFYTIDYQRMPGIVSSLESDHGIGLLGEKVNDLALAFVTPLRADDYHGLCHLATHLFDAPTIGPLNQFSVTLLILRPGVATAKIDDNSLVILP